MPRIRNTDKSDEQYLFVWKSKIMRKSLVGYAMRKLLNILKRDIRVKEASVQSVRLIFPWNKISFR